MTTNMAEVLKLVARPTPYDNDESTWLEFRFKLEGYFALVNEKYVALLQDAEPQLVANVPAGTEEASVLIRTLSHILYATLATLTTGRSLRLVQRVQTQEWVTIRQRSRKRGMRGNTSTRNWRRQSWMTM